MAKQSQQSPSIDQLALDILASIRTPQKVAEGSSPAIDVIANGASSVLNGLTRIGGALRASAHTAVDHYKLEKADQLDRAEISLANRAKEVAARMVARRQ